MTTSYKVGDIVKLSKWGVKTHPTYKTTGRNTYIGKWSDRTGIIHSVSTKCPNVVNVIWSGNAATTKSPYHTKLIQKVFPINH